MPEEYKTFTVKTHQNKNTFEHTDFTEEIIADADILYMTRVQRERFHRPDGIWTGEECIYSP